MATKTGKKKKKSSPVRQLLSPRRVFIPIAIGLAVAGWMLWREFDPQVLSKIHWTGWTAIWLLFALVMVAVRDLGYMYRIRILTDKEIKWRNSFDVIMLWEFASAISPSVVGGSAIALFIVNREGISLGRSTAVVMVTAFLDELFYIIMVPIVLFVVGTANLFPAELQKELLGFSLGAKQIFYVGYGFIVLLTSIIISSIFFFPRGFKRLIVGFTYLSFLKRWRADAIQTGNDIITTSKELRGKPFSFWGKAFGATLFSWTARFWVVNFLILAVGSLSFGEHMMVYARQLVMWVIMLISPTPGGTGVAEFMFSKFLGDYIATGFAEVIALMWRLLTYYPYLFVGAIVLPGWVRRVYLKRRLITFKRPESAN
ncbi:flippase-like domain-containing protein [bacterium SCSIO 12741]|nr:flippase-like domain-containing protein [bacterium SCSIO 12741]